MASSNSDTVKKLDELFNSLVDKANEGNVDVSIKIEVFKEGIRWVAVKNKLPVEETPAETGRLGKFKRGLSRS